MRLLNKLLVLELYREIRKVFLSITDDDCLFDETL